MNYHKRKYKIGLDGKRRDKYGRDLDNLKLWRRKRKEKLKRRAFSLLGDKCRICGYSDFRALQIDHINNDGVKERQIRKSNPPAFFNRILKSIKNKEGKYQLLCANCNTIKELERRKNNSS